MENYILNIRLLLSLWFVAGVSFVQAQGLDRVALEIEINLADSLLGEDQDSIAKISIDKIAGESLIQSDPIFKLRYHKLLGDYYLSQNLYEKAVKSYEPILETSRNLDKDNSLKLAKAINDLGIAYMKVGRIPEAIEAHHRSIKIYQHYADPQGSAYNYNNLAVIYKELKKIDSAIYFHGRSIEYAIQADDSVGIGFNHLNIGILQVDNKEPIHAMDHLQSALQVFEAIKNESLIVATKRRLARVYKTLKDYESAIELQQYVLRYYEEKKSKGGLASVHVDISELLMGVGEFDSAKYHIDKSIEINTDVSYAKGLTKGYTLLGQYYQNKEEYNLAFENYKKSLKLSQDKFIGMEANNLKGMSEIYFKQGDYQRAIYLAYQSLDKIDYSASLANLAGAYELLYQSYRALGNSAKALEYLELLNQQKDLMFGEDQTLEIARIEYRNRLERERALEQEKQRIKELAYQQELARERWMLIGAIVVIVLLSMVAFMAYRSYKIKQLANKQLAEKNFKLKELRESEKKLSEETIASRERELATMAMASHEKNALLKDLEQKVSFVENRLGDDMKSSLKEMRKTISESYALDKSWDSFLHRFEDVHPQFFDGLKNDNPNLTVEDLKLSAYLKIGMTNKEIANVTHLTLGSVKSKINRLKKKLEMGPDDSVRDYMLKYA